MTGRPWLDLQILLMVAFFLQVAQSFPPVSRHKRHSDSLFTSELSKARGRTAARNFLNSILETQTSSSLSSTPGKVKRHLNNEEDMTHRGFTVTLQDLEEILSAFQSPERGKMPELFMRRHDVPTEPKEILTFPSRVHPCTKWFYIYYLAKSISSNNSYLPAAALMDRSCGIIRQIVEDLQLEAFQTLQ